MRSGIKMGMKPPNVGTFIRVEALEELGLSVSALSAGMIVALRQNFFQPGVVTACQGLVSFRSPISLA